MARARFGSWGVPHFQGNPVSQALVAGMVGAFLVALGLIIISNALPWLPAPPIPVPIPSFLVLGEGAVAFGIAYCAAGGVMLYDARCRLRWRWLRTAAWAAAWACLMNTWLYVVGLLLLGPNIPVISLSALTTLLVSFTVIAFCGRPLVGRAVP